MKLLDKIKEKIFGKRSMCIACGKIDYIKKMSFVDYVYNIPAYIHITEKCLKFLDTEEYKQLRKELGMIDY